MNKLSEDHLGEMALLLVKAHMALSEVYDAPISVHVVCQDHDVKSCDPPGKCQVIDNLRDSHKDIERFVHEHKLETITEGG